MSHAKRAPVSRHKPHHVTVRVARGTWNLRSQRAFAHVRDALRGVYERAGFRVVLFSVQRDHVHLVTEANDRRAMANGMRALLIRLARGLNRMMAVTGRRFGDRYHEHILATPTQVRNVLRYVVENRARHLAKDGRAQLAAPVDAFSSAAAHDARPDAATVPLVRPPGSWLLREGLRLT